MSTDDTYNSLIVMQVTGLSPRQFEYLMRDSNALHPGSGYRRRFTADEVVTMARYAELLRYGFKASRAWDLATKGDQQTSVVSLCCDWDTLTERVLGALGHQPTLATDLV